VKWLRALGVVFATIALTAIPVWVFFLYKPMALETMHLASPWWALAALVIPFAVWRMTLGADARVPRLGLATLAPMIVGPRGVLTRIRDLPGIVRGVALILAVMALTRPQNVLRGESAEERGIDIVIVLDLSDSMKAVMDAPNAAVVPGQRRHRPTRLDTAKEVIADFIGRRKTDRIGIVVFGRAAYVLMPPTLDYSLLTTVVQKMDLDVVPNNKYGTAIGDAVGTAVARLRRSTAKSRAVILLTDGDSNAGSVSPEYATHLAQSQGVRVYTVQLGNGDEVDVEDGTDFFGQPKYVKMHYPVNPALLQKMSNQTGGESFVATDRKGLEESMHAILDRLEKSKIQSQAATIEELFPFFLVPAVLMLAIEALLRVVLVRRFP
jgi:Ca-activated chloride channel family protein